MTCQKSSISIVGRNRTRTKKACLLPPSDARETNRSDWPPPSYNFIYLLSAPSPPFSSLSPSPLLHLPVFIRQRISLHSKAVACRRSIVQSQNNFSEEAKFGFLQLPTSLLETRFFLFGFLFPDGPSLRDRPSRPVNDHPQAL